MTHVNLKLQAKLDVMSLDELVSFIDRFKANPIYTRMTEQGLDTLEDRFLRPRGVFKKLTRKQQQAVLSQFEDVPSSHHWRFGLVSAREHYKKTLLWWVGRTVSTTVYVGIAALALWVVTSPRATQSTQPSSYCTPSPWGGCTYE